MNAQALQNYRYNTCLVLCLACIGQIGIYETKIEIYVPHKKVRDGFALVSKRRK